MPSLVLVDVASCLLGRFRWHSRYVALVNPLWLELTQDSCGSSWPDLLFFQRYEQGFLAGNVLVSYCIFHLAFGKARVVSANLEQLIGGLLHITDLRPIMQCHWASSFNAHLGCRIRCWQYDVCRSTQYERPHSREVHRWLGRRRVASQ